MSDWKLFAADWQNGFVINNAEGVIIGENGQCALRWI